MAYADNATGGRVIESFSSPVYVSLSEGVEVGDLIGVKVDLTWVRADANADIFPELVAGQRGASGDTVVAYRTAVVSGVTGGTKGKPLFLANAAGETLETVGADLVLVGRVLTATTILLHPGAPNLIPVGADQETVSADKTLDVNTDSGTWQLVDTDAKTITLPATATGVCYNIMNIGADAAVLVTISPNSADKIIGMGSAATDNKDILNTKATARTGDYVRLVGHADGWAIQEIVGIWAREA